MANSSYMLWRMQFGLVSLMVMFNMKVGSSWTCWWESSQTLTHCAATLDVNLAVKWSVFKSDVMTTWIVSNDMLMTSQITSMVIQQSWHTGYSIFFLTLEGWTHEESILPLIILGWHSASLEMLVPLKTQRLAHCFTSVVCCIMLKVSITDFPSMTQNMKFMSMSLKLV